MTVFETGARGTSAGIGLHATLGPTLTLTGNLYAQQDFVVRGTITGDIDLPDHTLTITAEGRVTGRVFARAVTIDGTFDGSITATTRVQVFAGARIRGEITTPRLFVEDGALLQGKADTTRTDAAMRVARYRLEKRMAAS